MMISIIRFIDRHLGAIACNFLALFKKQKERRNKKIESILIIQLWGIGESILTLPAIAALREKFSGAKIDVLSTKRNLDVFIGNKKITNVILLGMNPFSILGFLVRSMKKYDIAVDMEEYLNVSAIISFFAGKSRLGFSCGARSKLYTQKVRYNDMQHAVLTFLDLARKLGIDHDAKVLPRLNSSENDKKSVDSILRKEKIRKVDFLVCVAPGAAESAKCRMWPHERYSSLCDEIILRHNARIIFVGSKGEKGLIAAIRSSMDNKAKTIDTSGDVSLTQLFYLVSKTDLFIGNDSGAMHIAAAQGVKTIGLFGPNLPVRFGPYGQGNIGIYKGYNCKFSPCINVHKGQIPDCIYPKDSNDYQKCMKNISVDDVLKKVEGILTHGSVENLNFVKG